MQPGIGVFGTGTAVRCLVPILKSCGFEVQAIWGRTKDLAEDAARDLNIPFCTNKVDDVLLRKDVDLVFISCPPHLQSPIAVKALGIGKHVICGTPAGPGQTDAFKMVNGARYYPSLMSLMCYGLRFLPAFTKMRTLINDGYIGDFNVCEVRVQCGSMLKEDFDWMCDELMGGGILNTIGGAVIDIISFVTNQRASKVHGLLKTFTQQTTKINGIRKITSDDFCSFQMELQNGSCAIVTLNNHVPGQFVHEVLTCGTRGRLIARGADLYGQKCEAHKEELIYHDPVNLLDVQKSNVSGNIRADIPIPYLKGLIRLIDSVKDAFKSVADRHGWSKTPVSQAATFEDALYIQTVIDAVRKSSHSGEWVKVKIMTEEPDPNPFLSAAVRRSTFSLYS
ncbi:glucose-fructose oxidoreductase domain-containing protein 2-like [Tubulanus polymorphus]|uniref:glucose-fructose oxidoreductase domain-containing protein 2-like n=1 Tax=Tubulanus polymorphus TaxID=672921 RepID=UPI003DA6408E